MNTQQEVPPHRCLQRKASTAAKEREKEVSQTAPKLYRCFIMSAMCRFSFSFFFCFLRTSKKDCAILFFSLFALLVLYTNNTFVHCAHVLNRKTKAEFLRPDGCTHLLKSVFYIWHSPMWHKHQTDAAYESHDKLSHDSARAYMFIVQPCLQLSPTHWRAA